jgi:hypothetical protein
MAWFLILLLLLSTPGYLLIGWVIFGSWTRFWDAVKEVFWQEAEPWEPEAHQGVGATVRMVLFLLACVALVFLEYQLLHDVFAS